MMRLFVAVFAFVLLSAPLKADPFWGAIDGGFEGAIIGGIIGGEEGAIDGAIIGGTIGAIEGAERQYQRDRMWHRDRYYRPAPKRQPKQQSKSANLVLEVQLALRRLGYNPGPADGIAGKATGRAVAQYKRDYGLPQDNIINRNLLKHMKQNGG